MCRLHCYSADAPAAAVVASPAAHAPRICDASKSLPDDNDHAPKRS
jgi:hypothetical protein